MHCPPFITIAIAVTLAPLSIPTTSCAQAHTKGREVAPLTPALKPGDYAWHPEVAPAGPVVILVSLPDQLLYVYRNGLRIGRSTVSTGKAVRAPKNEDSSFNVNSSRRSLNWHSQTK